MTAPLGTLTVKVDFDTDDLRKAIFDAVEEAMLLPKAEPVDEPMADWERELLDVVTPQQAPFIVTNIAQLRPGQYVSWARDNSWGFVGNVASVAGYRGVEVSGTWNDPSADPYTSTEVVYPHEIARGEWVVIRREDDA